ncbi:MAG: RdgB/HAM1 family non-canonical purine NTP pyrophosphatase [Ruminococcaceae bacterium]|nr:RdgB/HAM1 family non-canonical purine NTP pyrophosphatase [Oscillospiraceae bacterium]
MKIVLASRNKHKIEEWQATLGKYVDGVEILSLDEVGIYGDIEENGETFAENALIKARVAAKSGYMGVGEDSGLSVNVLGGEPGIYSARYAGEHGNDRKNNELLLSKLSDKTDRSASFVCTIACVLPDNIEGGELFVGKTYGEIINEYRGNNGFGYDPIFYVESMDKTFAEMSGEEKNAISHRGKAIELFAEWLKNLKN